MGRPLKRRGVRAARPNAVQECIRVVADPRHAAGEGGAEDVADDADVAERAVWTTGLGLEEQPS